MLFKRYFIFRTNFAALFTKPTSVSVNINLAPWCHTIKNATPLSEVPEIQLSNEINRSDEWLNTDEEQPDEIKHVAYITMRVAPSHYSKRTSCSGYECIVDIMEILHTLQRWPLNIINNSCVSPWWLLHPKLIYTLSSRSKLIIIFLFSVKHRRRRLAECLSLCLSYSGLGRSSEVIR